MGAENNYKAEANDQIQRAFGASDRNEPDRAMLHIQAANAYALLHIADAIQGKAEEA